MGVDLGLELDTAMGHGLSCGAGGSLAGGVLGSTIRRRDQAHDGGVCCRCGDEHLGKVRAAAAGIVFCRLAGSQVDGEGDTTHVGTHSRRKEVCGHCEGGLRGGGCKLRDGSEAHDDVVDSALVCWRCLHVRLRGLRRCAGCWDAVGCCVCSIWRVIAAHAHILHKDKGDQSVRRAMQATEAFDNAA